MSASSFSKRAMDLLLAIPAMLVTAPLVGVLAALVKLSSQGPAFYAQERLGRDGCKITIYKLRTMTVDAEATGPHVTPASGVCCDVSSSTNSPNSGMSCEVI